MTTISDTAVATTATEQSANPSSPKRAGCSRRVGVPGVVSSALDRCSTAAASSQYAMGYSGSRRLVSNDDIVGK